MNLLLRILLIGLLMPVSVLGQSDLLKGKLIDASTLEPVAFATVRVKGGSVGVISNYDGSFRIPEKFKLLGDTLEISSMGYDNREILMSTLSVENVRRIYVEPALFELNEAIVVGKKKRRLSARRIVRKAIENITKNYPVSPFSTVGYYRDYQMKGGEYVNLNEAVLEVFDKGFLASDSATTEVRLYDYKKNFDFERDTLADDPYDYKDLQKIIDNAYLDHYGGNEFAILRVHDAIRNHDFGSYSFVDRLDIDLLRNHSFTKDNSTYINGEAVYTIKFKKAYPNYRAYGLLYISHSDFSIHKMEYTLYDDRKRRRDGELNRHGGRGRLLMEVATEYQRKQNRMFLNYVSFHNSFILWEPPKFKVDSVALELRKNCFVVEFNRFPNTDEATSPDNYKVRFGGNRLKIKKVVSFENKVFLFPDIDQEERLLMTEGLVKAQKDSVDLKELLSVEVKPITDIDGNILHKWRKRDYNQFREYFVQQIKPDARLPKDVQFMNNRKPIFKDQPIDPPENFDDYWMNTPLQRVDEFVRVD